MRAGATVGTNPRGSRSSDGVIDRTKKRNKGDLEVARNKELSTGEQTVEQVVYSILPHGLLQSYLRGVALCESSRWERRGEKRLFYWYGTHVRYIYYIVRDIMWYCTVATMMSSMRHL